MSSAGEAIGAFGHVFSLVCENLDDDVITSGFLFYDMWPFYLGILLIGVTIEHSEVFYSLVTWIFFIDFFFNFGIRSAIDQPGPQLICTSSIQMPAYATEGAMLLTMYLLISSSVSFNFSLRWLKIFIIGVFLPLGIYSRIWLHFNTPQQLLAGSAFGIFFGLVWVVVTRFLVDRFYGSILFKTFVGTDYIDTMINRLNPVICFYNTPYMINWKVKENPIDRDRQAKRRREERLRKLTQVSDDSDVDGAERIRDVEDPSKTPLVNAFSPLLRFVFDKT